MAKENWEEIGEEGISSVLSSAASLARACFAPSLPCFISSLFWLSRKKLLGSLLKITEGCIYQKRNFGEGGSTLERAKGEVNAGITQNHVKRTLKPPCKHYGSCQQSTLLCCFLLAE